MMPKEIPLDSADQYDVPTWAGFSPDGSRVLTVSTEGDVSYWDAATARPMGGGWLLDRPLCAAFSFEGSRLLIGGSGKTHIFDIASGKELLLLKHAKAVLSVGFSPDGLRIVTASDDSTARIWDAATGSEIAVLSHLKPVRSASFNLDGTRVVTASWDCTARIWEVTTGAEVGTFHHESLLHFAAFSTDGKRIVTACDDKVAVIWNTETGNRIGLLHGHRAPVSTAAFNSDGTRIVTASDDATARIWDAATGVPIAILWGTGDVDCASFSHDGTQVVTVCSVAQRVQIWNVHFATMTAEELLREVCTRRLRGRTKLNRDEMGLAGYADSTPEIDVWAGTK
jgi:WD40 repeat protein